MEKLKDESQMIKFLKVKWYISKKNKAWFDYKDYIWKIPTYASGPGYRNFKQ